MSDYEKLAMEFTKVHLAELIRYDRRCTESTSQIIEESVRRGLQTADAMVLISGEHNQ